MGNVYVHNSNNWILNQMKYNLNAQIMNICTNIVTKTIEAQHIFIWIFSFIIDVFIKELICLTMFLDIKALAQFHWKRKYWALQ